MACAIAGVVVISTAAVVAEVAAGFAIVVADMAFPFMARRVEQRLIGAALRNNVGVE
jgi:hypothetical protein